MIDKSRSRRKPGVTGRARTLRKAGNITEAILWDELKDRKLGGYKFVRQHTIPPYYADFACRKARLVVEIDGSQHADSNSDRARDEFMLERGWSIVRLWSTDVLKELTSVCDTILAALDGKLTRPVEACDLRFVPAMLTRSELSRSSTPLTGRFAATSPPLREGRGNSAGEQS